MRARLMLFVILGASVAAAAVQAQGNSVINILGTVEKVDATSISVKDDSDGAEENFRLAPNLLVLQNKAATLADIRPNDFVASAAVRKADGKLHSTELRIFPEAMRGLGEGQRPMNDGRHQTMTNATVAGTAVVNGSNDIGVKFDGGESELILDPGVPVTRIEPANIDLVRAGEKVRLRGQRTADGMSIDRITIQ
jgi:hypothetical protein